MKLPGIKNPIAYFCNEFAIDNELPTYAGGLGVLAADVINEAAVQHLPMVGIGILYKGKQFLQHITKDGKAETRDSEFDHDTSFLRQTTKDGKPISFDIIPGRNEVLAKSYHIRFSDSSILFLLSTDLDSNPSEWVSDMDTLYMGNDESHFRQQLLLGVGGVKLLEILDIKPSFYHINEGRPEFIIWEITKNLMLKEGKSFDDAWSAAKEKIIYTNHTLVSAGNLSYPKKLVEKWAIPFAQSMKVDTNVLIKDGISDSQTFSTTQFALSISSKQTAVSKIHAEYAKKEWPNFNWIPITNGVYLPRWQDSDFRRDLSDKEIWDLHNLKKKELMETVIQRTGFGYDPGKLVITWARRLAEYKQPKIIFSDIKRLRKIVTNSQQPVQILFAGNSHTSDPRGKEIIEEIIEIFSSELSGSAIFVPNYNISLANRLTSGSDVWLNTPQGDMEASGTSGMKAASNGVLNCTVLDGWTYEVDWNGIGWTLDPKNVAESFYEILEKEISPLYFQRNEQGVPIQWLERMKKSINLSKNYSSERMLHQYKELLYS
jgi:alpha-glucan phosphorylase-like protein